MADVDRRRGPAELWRLCDPPSTHRGGMAEMMLLMWYPQFWLECFSRTWVVAMPTRPSIPSPAVAGIFSSENKQ